MIRVPVKPEILRWARERAGHSLDDLEMRFQRLPDWESGAIHPTWKQLEAFSRTVHVPFGYLFLSKPPQEDVHIPDFRSNGGLPAESISTNLLEMIHACQERQSWYREFASDRGEPPLGFVGSASLEMDPETVARKMRDVLDFNLERQQEYSTWTDALGQLNRQADQSGVLVMVSGIVKSNTRRPLDPAEFLGFALSDPLAPLIFVNRRHTSADLMFVAAHELAHLWLGESALSNLGAAPGQGLCPQELWCNAVAAEFLVPLEALRLVLNENESLTSMLTRLARHFKVSTLVILRRLLDAGWLTRRRFESAFKQERARPRCLVHSGVGCGNFHRTTVSRVGMRFAQALTACTLEGRTLYRDAFQMLGIRKTATFRKIALEVGVK